MNPSSLFSLSDHLAALSKHGDPLEVLDATVDFEYFRGWPGLWLTGRSPTVRSGVDVQGADPAVARQVIA